MAYENLAAGMLVGGFLIGFLIVLLIAYVIMAWALMTIAKKTNTDNAWLAWIPIANVFLIANIAKQHWAWALGAILVSIIPFLGGLISLIIMIFLFWHVCEARNKPGALSLLLIIPIVNLGFFLYLAFSD